MKNDLAKLRDRDEVLTVCPGCDRIIGTPAGESSCPVCGVTVSPVLSSGGVVAFVAVHRAEWKGDDVEAFVHLGMNKRLQYLCASKSVTAEAVTEAIAEIARNIGRTCDGVKAVFVSPEKIVELEFFCPSEKGFRRVTPRELENTTKQLETAKEQGIVSSGAKRARPAR